MNTPADTAGSGLLPRARILVLYATREGQTEKVASRIAQHLRDGDAEVVLANAADAPAVGGLDLRDFDLLVFGASMHAGGLEQELTSYVNANAGPVSRYRRAFFLVLLSAATRDPGLREASLADAIAKMDEQLDVDFEDVEMIAGALMYSKYPLPLRWLMRRLAKKAGGDTDTSRDYEYTDWEQVARYARRLLAML